jgi:hypothetical protein
MHENQQCKKSSDASFMAKGLITTAKGITPKASVCF